MVKPRRFGAFSRDANSCRMGSTACASIGTRRFDRTLNPWRIPVKVIGTHHQAADKEHGGIADFSCYSSGITQQFK